MCPSAGRSSPRSHNSQQSRRYLIGFSIHPCSCALQARDSEVNISISIRMRCDNASYAATLAENSETYISSKHTYRFESRRYERSGDVHRTRTHVSETIWSCLQRNASSLIPAAGKEAFYTFLAPSLEPLLSLRWIVAGRS